MADNSISNATTSQLTAGVQTFSASSQVPDSAEEIKQTFYEYPNSSEFLGYYKQIPELKKAIDALATWTTGKGMIGGTPLAVKDFIGFGKDSFQTILWNLQAMKKVLGDAFAQIVRNDKGTIVNLKPLWTGSIRSVFNSEGILEKYIYRVGNQEKTFEPHELFHLVNDRVANEVHGVSVIEACKWVINARNEAMEDWRRISHRSTIRILYVDIEDTSKINTLRTQYKEGIDKGEVLILPIKKGDAEFEDLKLPPHDAFLSWIQYLENFFYQAVGVPRVIATSENYTEAASKVGYLTFEPIYTQEQTELEEALWNQCAIRIKFNKPPSLMDNQQQDQAKDSGQLGFSESEVNTNSNNQNG